MEHEVFVPVPAQRLREALADPAQVARAVPGLQAEAGTEPVAGRLKVRIGSHSITYRGTLRVSAGDEGTYAVEGDATESRGTGSVKFALTLRVRDTDAGSTLTFDGTAIAGGRVAELDPEAVRAAAARLLNRFAEGLAEDTEPRPAAPSGRIPAFETEVLPPSPDPLADEEDQAEDHNGEDRPGGERDEEAEEQAERDDILEPVLPPTGAETGTEAVSDTFAEAEEPPAEAAHARRTMIGRSAEEVDHAPPRGRYAPVPAPLTVSGNPVLRWAAPAAALAVASAIVVGRALRRRR
ncbi:SRPBCC domain-containing protein [Streptomyces sp. NPDC020801]|uniref:SRPBCC domain-containing protein n=1 Tax=unclassified Streptomyces TaxID=2593676 RepID=UPI0037AFCF21